MNGYLFLKYVMQQEGIQEKDYVVEKLESSQTKSEVKEKFFRSTEIRLTQKAYEGIDAASFSTVSHELGHFFTNRENKIHFFTYYFCMVMFVFYLFFVIFFDALKIIEKNVVHLFAHDFLNKTNVVLTMKSLPFLFLIFTILFAYFKTKDEILADKKAIFILNTHFKNFLITQQYLKNKEMFLEDCLEDVESNKQFKKNPFIMLFIVWCGLTVAYFPFL